jgi:hypothetical protein
MKGRGMKKKPFFKNETTGSYFKLFNNRAKNRLRLKTPFRFWLAYLVNTDGWDIVATIFATEILA